MNASPQQDRFWQWFLNHGDRLRAAIYGKDARARDAALEELRQATEQTEQPVLLEIGPSSSQVPHTLIVSADGNPERTDAVKDFAASAPFLPGWKVMAFRPRMPVNEDIEIGIEDERIGFDDIWFHVEPDDNGLNLSLYVRGLTPDNERMRGLGASILAQHAVGERDVLTLLSGLHILPLPADPAAEGLHPFGDLAGAFDHEREKKYPPPGALPLEETDEWQNMSGTMQEYPILVLLNSGIRSFAGHPDYDRSLTVTIAFNEADETGMPAEEEYQEVGQLEDRFSEALQEGQQSLLVVSFMTQGRREMLFYTSDADAALERIQAIRNEVQSHSIDVEIERDSYWGRYRTFCNPEEEAEEEE